MKLNLAPTLFLFTSSLVFFPATFAQMVAISSPAPGTSLTPNESFVVELDSANGLTNFQHISVAMGLITISNATDGASSSSTVLGDMLYAGAYSPELHESNKPQYQNFTVTVPSGLQAGNTTLNVAHFYVVGAGLTPVMEIANISVMISDSD